MSDYAYYKVKRNSPLEATIRDFDLRRMQQRKKQFDIEKETGAEATIEQGGSMEGLEIKGECPAGLGPKSKHPASWKFPLKKTKEGKEWARRFKEAHSLTARDFSREIGQGFVTAGRSSQGFGFRILFYSLEWIDGAPIILAPLNMKGDTEWVGGNPPEGAIPLKNSEYWAMKEMAEKKQVDAQQPPQAEGPPCAPTGDAKE